MPADSDSAAQAAKVIARGGQQANAQAQAAHQVEDQGSAFDVWTHTGSGLGQRMQDFAADPAGSLLSISAPAQTARIAEAVVSRPWQSSSPSAVRQSMAAQVSDLSKAKDAVGEAEGALATTGAVFSLLTSVEQTLSTALSVIPFPGFPAVRIGDFAFGFPHAHAHPPNLTPPNPVPVPLPSFGPIIPIPFLSGARRVLINGMPAARCGDLGIGVWCGGYFPMYEIFLGSSNVWIEGARAARIGVDLTLHCVFSTPKPSDLPIGLSIGTTVTSSPNVLIGGIPMPSLTSLAIGTAFRVVFAGLGKVLRAAQKSSVFSRLGGREAGTAGREAGAVGREAGTVGREAGAVEREATGFLGRRGYELKNAPYQKVRNEPTRIGGRDYSGHALDQMQNRGVMPSVVENTINPRNRFPGKKAGTTMYYDAVNNVRVIVNSETGRVVTVIRGAPR
jgi:uncharacterized Zn-binding protein involved in type VI secretion